MVIERQRFRVLDRSNALQNEGIHGNDPARPQRIGVSGAVARHDASKHAKKSKKARGR